MGMSTCTTLPSDSRNETVDPPEQLVVRTQEVEDKLRKLYWNLKMLREWCLIFTKK
jgi:hypothetical protein